MLIVKAVDDIIPHLRQWGCGFIAANMNLPPPGVAVASDLCFGGVFPVKPIMGLNPPR